MSRFVGKTELKSVVIKDLDDLREFCRFDSDLSGENGDDYLSEEAAEQGFECEGDFIFSRIDEEATLEDKVIQACQMIVDTSSEYYGFTVIEVEGKEDCVYVATIDSAC